MGTPIDVLVSTGGEVVVDGEATLRQPELRSMALVANEVMPTLRQATAPAIAAK